MKTENTSTRLKYIMKERNLRQVDILNLANPFAEKYGVKLKKNDLSQYVSGKVAPKQDKLTVLGLALNVSEAWLSGFDVPMQREKPPLPPDAIPYAPSGYSPILGQIPAGLSALAFEEIEGYEAVDVSDPDNCFWLRIKGDSMINAGITPGDLVLIRTQPCAEDGQIVACRVNGDESTLKRFKQQGDTVILLPENAAYNPIIVSCADFESGYAGIIGVVIELKRKF